MQHYYFPTVRSVSIVDDNTFLSITPNHSLLTNAPKGISKDDEKTASHCFQCRCRPSKIAPIQFLLALFIRVVNKVATNLVKHISMFKFLIDKCHCRKSRDFPHLQHPLRNAILHYRNSLLPDFLYSFWNMLC